MSLTLFVFEKPVDQPSGSMFCQKLETYLRASGYKDYTTSFTLPFSAPKGKLPYVKIDNAETIADSHFIIQHLIATGKTPDLDATLSPSQKADSRAWQGYIEELVYNTTVWSRWMEPDNWPVLKAEISSKMPFPLSAAIPYVLWRRVRTAMYYQGVGRHTTEENHILAKEYLTNLEARLPDGGVDGSESIYFFSKEEPTMIDVLVYGFSVNLLSTKSNPILRDGIVASQKLKNYVAVLTEKWFPEYKGILNLVKAEDSK